MNSSMQKERPVKVAIIGGGCAAVSAAFDLTRPEQEGKDDVTNSAIHVFVFGGFLCKSLYLRIQFVLDKLYFCHGRLLVRL